MMQGLGCLIASLFHVPIAWSDCSFTMQLNCWNCGIMSFLTVFPFFNYLQRCSEIQELSQNTFLWQSVLPIDILGTHLVTSCSNISRWCCSSKLLCVYRRITHFFKKLCLQQNFVTAARHTKSNQLQFVWVIAVTKFCWRDKNFTKKFSSMYEAVFSSFSGILHFLMTTHLEFMRKYFQAKWSGQNTWRPLQPSKFFFS